MSIQKSYPYILMIGSFIGLLASFILGVDTIKFLKNPDISLLCDINPFISCTSVANTWQSEIFGFSNSLLGIVVFSMFFTVGVMLFFNGRPKRFFWLLVNLNCLAAMVFVIWFFYQSVYNIGSLCLYCMIVWIVTWPLFLYTTIWNFRENHFSIENTSRKSFLFLQMKHQNTIDSFFHFVSRNHFQILAIWYLVVIFLILFRFRDFFFTSL